VLEYTVKINKSYKIIEKKVESGTNLIDFMRIHSLDINSPCGGHGTCGKCRVKVNGLKDDPTIEETKLLGEEAITKGYRLACYNNITSDIEVYIENTGDNSAKIITEGRSRVIKIQPLITKKFVELTLPDIHDQSDDLSRLFINNSDDKNDKIKSAYSLNFLRNLPETFRKENFKITTVIMDENIIAVESGDTTSELYGIAVDIGTTTVAGYLIDLATGDKLDVYSSLNPQKKYGADVISRINYTMEFPDSLENMNDAIITCLNNIVDFFISRNNIAIENIYTIVLVGNTTMIHFLLKISAKYIASAPFIPVTTSMHKIIASELGININIGGIAVIFPAVAAYIGADTVAAVMSSGMYASNKISLLVDLGTNGEIVLGNNEWLYSCSAAAGPAFEGANIRNGIAGIKGAIDKVELVPKIKITTIGNKKAIGICGSGIVDVIAGMLSVGIIDETGRILMDESDNNIKDRHLLERLVTIDGLNAFLILKSEDSDLDTDIAITQKDVRELQNAKAAIAAGIKVLIQRAGIKTNDIDKVYLAGGFGSYINIDNALKIGLFPKELEGKVESIGNAAGEGAIEGLISEKMLKKADVIKNEIKYIELSACPEFMDEYIESMMFE